MENKVVYLSDGTEVYLKGKLDTGQSVVCEFVEYDTECGPEVEELAVKVVDNVYDTYNETPQYKYNKKRLNELDEQIKTKQSELQELTQAVKEKSINIVPKFKIGDTVWIVAWNEIRKETVSSIRITVTKDKIGYEYKSGSSETLDSPFLTEEEARKKKETNVLSSTFVQCRKSHRLI